MLLFFIVSCENEKVYVEMPLSIRKQGKVEAKEDTIWTASKFQGLLEVPNQDHRGRWNEIVKTGSLFVCRRSCHSRGFVDDVLFWVTDQAYINELGNKLHKQGLLLEQEDDAAGFLASK